jgi:hypothetical protein
VRISLGITISRSRYSAGLFTRPNARATAKLPLTLRNGLTIAHAGASINQPHTPSPNQADAPRGRAPLALFPPALSDGPMAQFLPQV